MSALDKEAADAGAELWLLVEKFCGKTQEEFDAEFPIAPMGVDFRYIVFRGSKQAPASREGLTLGELRAVALLFEQETALLIKCAEKLVRKYVLENSSGVL